MTEKTKISLIACAKNEGPFLLEWVAHHKVLGFDKIAVATNDCDDHTDTIAQRLADQGEILHLENHAPYEMTTNGGLPSIQHTAYRRMQELPEIWDSKWIMALDLDEFLVLNGGDGTIHDFVSRNNKAHSLAFRWRVFGTNNIKGMVDAPITDKLIKASTTDDPRNDQVKSLTREHQKRKLGPHISFLNRLPINPSKWAKALDKVKRERSYITTYIEGKYFKIPQNANTKIINQAFAKIDNAFHDGQVNHYALRTHDLGFQKRARGKATPSPNWPHDIAYHHKFDRNEVEDHSIQRYREERDKNLNRYLSDPELKRLHEEAHEITRAKLVPFDPGPEIKPEDRPTPKDMPTLFLLAPWASGSTAVAGYLARAGAFSCPPHFLTNDDRTTDAYESLRFRSDLKQLIQERKLIMRDKLGEFEQEFASWIPSQIIEARAEAHSALVLKHPLSAYVIISLNNIAAAKFVVLTRPMEKIAATSKRRGWSEPFGPNGAKTIYSEIEKGLKQNNIEPYRLDFDEFLTEKSVRQDLLAFAGLTPTKKQLADAEAWLR